jgi:GAF domain-containing protein
MEMLSQLPGYDSCFLYRLEGSNLLLDTFVGEETEHTVIPVGRGVCGTAVAENANQIVTNVTDLDNYLCCSLKTKSEIVVLIRQGEEILGQIDIDGHTAGSFDNSDETFLEEVAATLSAKWDD